MRRKLIALMAAMALGALLLVEAAPASAVVVPAGLTYVGPASAATGATATLAATVGTAAGAPVSGASVSFALANQPAVAATTDANGLASAAVRVLKSAGTYTLTVSTAGQPDKTLDLAVSNANTFNIVVPGGTAGGNGGEPSLEIAPDGTMYASSPAGPIFVRSTDNGATWKKPGTPPFSSSGDTSLSTDQSGAVYLTNLNGIGSSNTLQTDLYKSKAQGATGSWVKGAGPATNANTTNMPLLTDRQWGDSYVPAGGTTDTARVYLSYHDWGPSQLWVQTSTDGGAHFGLPFDVITDPQAEAATFCNSIPGGLKVVKSGPRAGRVYVAWLGGDLATNLATGCNDTQLNTFHTVWIAYSDNADAMVPTWTDKLVYDGNIGHDGSGLFADLTLDNAGNPYVGFGMEGAGQAIGTHTEFDMFLSASFDGGNTWRGPFNVAPGQTGTHVYPAVAAGDPGQVSVAFLRTDAVIPLLPYGKPAPGGVPTAKWYLYVAQSLDLGLTTGAPTWNVTQATPNPMHIGEICTLGIFCSATGGDRTILDFIDAVIDLNGYTHVAICDNGDSSASLDIANQSAGAAVKG
ncbi:MAG: sialidase family protein [Actinomycetota bacterium]